MRAGIASITICFILAACGGGASQTAGTSQSAGPLPENYKVIVQEEIRKSYFDPYSLRDVSISTPVAGNLPYQSGAGAGWIVCVEANGKNKMGGYTGLKRTAFLIRNGAFVGGESEDFVTADICRTHVFSPWKLSISG